MQRDIGGVTNTSTFMPGDVAVLGYRRHEPADVVMPVRIVKDTAQLIAHYICPGTALKGQATVDGQKLTRDIPFLEREQMISGLADDTWSHNHVLQWIRPGEARSTWLL